jgi:hypothetical protein
MDLPANDSFKRSTLCTIRCTIGAAFRRISAPEALPPSLLQFSATVEPNRLDAKNLTDREVGEAL